MHHVHSKPLRVRTVKLLKALSLEKLSVSMKKHFHREPFHFVQQKKGDISLMNLAKSPIFMNKYSVLTEQLYIFSGINRGLNKCGLNRERANFHSEF